VPVRGDLGVRYVQTRQKSLGYGVVPSTVSGVNYQTISATTATRSYNDLLPALNLVIEPTEDLLIRFGAAKVMSRPNLGSLTPGVNIGTGSTKSVTSGNPFLDPYRAKTYDAGVRMVLPAPGPAVLRLLLQGHLDLRSELHLGPVDLRQEPVRPAGQRRGRGLRHHAGLLARPAGLAVQHLGQHARRSAEGLRAELPAALHLPAGPVRQVRLPGQLHPRDVDVTYLSSTGAVAAIGPLTNLSKTATTPRSTYEDKKISSRVSAAYRSKYLTQIPGRNGSDVEGTKATLNFDASLTYTWNKNLAFTWRR
jgi:iron complex outermembrane receptor protein